MKINKIDPFISSQKYVLKNEKIINTFSLRQTSWTSPSGAPEQNDGQFVTRRSYEMKCTRYRKILSIFASFLLLPLVSKGIRLGIKGKKIVVSYTWSTCNERMALPFELRITTSDVRHRPIYAKHFSNLLTSEKMCQWKADKIQFENAYLDAEKKEDQTRMDSLATESLNSFNEAIAFLERRDEMTQRANFDQRFPAKPIEVRKDFHLQLIWLIEKRLAGKEYNEMNEFDKLLWQVVKKEIFLTQSTSEFKQNVIQFFEKQGSKGSDFLKNCYS